MDTRFKQLHKDIEELLAPEPGAIEFVKEFTNYVHLADDIIDSNHKDKSTILKAFSSGERLFSSDFYHKYRLLLYPVLVVCHNNYRDSVLWESSPVEWKRRHADTLRHSGLDVFFMVIFIVAGDEALQKISPLFREYTTLKHLNDLFTYDDVPEIR